MNHKAAQVNFKPWTSDSQWPTHHTMHWITKQCIITSQHKTMLKVETKRKMSINRANTAMQVMSHNVMSIAFFEDTQSNKYYTVILRDSN